LKSFDDLKTISTFGFRGEALASITHVSNVTIQSRTADSPCAYKAKYSDGKLVPQKVGDKADPKPCAGVVGTTITVEDLFHNMPARRSAFKNQNEQYQKILDVVIRYSIHFASKNISFTCKKQGQLNPDYHCPNSSSTKENIRIAFGHEVSQELLDFALTQQEIEAFMTNSAGGSFGSSSSESTGQHDASFQVSGMISNGNYSCKKNVLILFINNRLVENASIKKVVDAVYNDILPKHSHPFVYLSLTMPSQNIDVNVHPTKKEVHFLHEDVIVDAIYQGICNRLKGSNTSRVFYVQPSLSLTSGLARSQLGGASNKIDPANSDDIDVIVDDDDEVDDPMETTAAVATKPVAVNWSLFTNASSARARGGDIGRTNKRSFESANAPGGNVPIATLSSFAATSITTMTKSRSSSSLPANKFVRTDAKQMKINDVFRSSSVPAQPTTNTVGKNNEVVTHESFCSLATMEFCGVISGESSENETGKETLACTCCAASGTIMLPTAVPLSSSSSATGTVDIGAINSFEIVDTCCQYVSVRTMILEMYASKSGQLAHVLQNHTLVGIVDSTSMIVQYGTKLLLMDYALMAHNMLSQLVIRQFGELGRIQVEPPISIRECIGSVLSPLAQSSDVSLEQQVETHLQLLLSKAEMLAEYFSIVIGAEDGCVSTLPLIIPELVPDLHVLPIFLLMLCVRVNWESEQECFGDISRHLGFFYSYLAENPTSSSSSSGKSTRFVTLTDEAMVKFRTIIYPALRRHHIPLDEESRQVVQIASLEELYKVFERC
jgi:DNA mismatch repair protein MLH1